MWHNFSRVSAWKGWIRRSNYIWHHGLINLIQLISALAQSHPQMPSFNAPLFIGPISRGGERDFSRHGGQLGIDCTLILKLSEFPLTFVPKLCHERNLVTRLQLVSYLLLEVWEAIKGFWGWPGDGCLPVVEPPSSPRSLPVMLPEAPLPAFPHPEMESSCSSSLGCSQDKGGERARGFCVVVHHRGDKRCMGLSLGNPSTNPFWSCKIALWCCRGRNQLQEVWPEMWGRKGCHRLMGQRLPFDSSGLSTVGEACSRWGSPPTALVKPHTSVMPCCVVLVCLWAVRTVSDTQIHGDFGLWNIRRLDSKRRACLGSGREWRAGDISSASTWECGKCDGKRSWGTRALGLVLLSTTLWHQESHSVTLAFCKVTPDKIISEVPSNSKILEAKLQQKWWGTKIKTRICGSRPRKLFPYSDFYLQKSKQVIKIS